MGERGGMRYGGWNERREWGGYYKKSEGVVGGGRSGRGREGREGRNRVWRVRRREGVGEGYKDREGWVGGREGGKKGGREGGRVERRK